MVIVLMGPIGRLCFASPARFELATDRLEICCSIQLSYGDTERNYFNNSTMSFSILGLKLSDDLRNSVGRKGLLGMQKMGYLKT